MLFCRQENFHICDSFTNLVVNIQKGEDTNGLFSYTDRKKRMENSGRALGGRTFRRGGKEGKGMTSRFKKILCILLSISMLCSIPVFATGREAASDSEIFRASAIETYNYKLTGSNSAQVYADLTVNTSEYYDNDGRRMVKVNYIKVTAANGTGAYYCSSINIQLRIVSGHMSPPHEHDEYKTFSSPKNGTPYYFYPTNNHYHIVNIAGFNSLYVKATFNATGGGAIVLERLRNTDKW